jgi:hypothetical protein
MRWPSNLKFQDHIPLRAWMILRSLLNSTTTFTTQQRKQKCVEMIHGPRKFAASRKTHTRTLRTTLHRAESKLKVLTNWLTKLPVSVTMRFEMRTVLEHWNAEVAGSNPTCTAYSRVLPVSCCHVHPEAQRWADPPSKESSISSNTHRSDILSSPI